MFSRVLITAQVCKIELSCYFIIMLPQINLERMTRCKICSLRTVCSTIVWSRYVFSSQNGEFTATNSNAFIVKTKHFPAIFYGLFRVQIIFGTFGKKSPASQLKYFQNYSLRKRWILEWLVGLVSENPSAANMLMGPNHGTSMQNRTFILVFQHSYKGKVGKHDPL